MIKRVFDIFFSILGLILLSPVFIIVAIWIGIDTRGPIFFKQARVGFHEKIFYIHKFRTMIHNTENFGGLLTLAADNRITNAGVVLRKYKLDELPQIIDVLLGKMSFVGPRPEVLKYVSYYPEEAKKIIFSVRPGITDHASIIFKHENKLLSTISDAEYFYINEILPVKIQYYIEYVKSYSIKNDLKIIFLTLKEIFF